MTTLKSRNVVVGGHRTSMRLEPEMWDALAVIARRERSTVNAVCSRIAAGRGNSSLTSAVRVFALDYFRELAGMPRSGAPAGRRERRRPPPRVGRREAAP